MRELKKNSRAMLRSGASALVLACGLPAISLAQDASSQPSDDLVFEEIMVSATRRVESIQDVPVSVSSISAATIEKTGVIDIAELSRYIPNFEMSDAAILPNLYVRGIGSGTTHSIEQSVGRFIDDVYISRAAINFHPLMDVQNVEVLRGPQGTLFGKNTLAGAMIVNTGNPSQDFDAKITATASDYSTVGGTVGAEGYITGGLTETLSARFAFTYRDRDGYLENASNGPDGGTREDWGTRLKLRWDASDKTTVDFKAEHMWYQEDGLITEVVAAGFPEAVFQRFDPNFSFDQDWTQHINCNFQLGDSTFCPARDQDSTNFTLNIAHQFEGAGELRFISALQLYDYEHQFLAPDEGVVGGAVRFFREEEFEGFTQEIRWTSEEFEHFDYIVGAFFEDSQVERLQTDDFNIAALLGGGPPSASFNEDWIQDTMTIATFAQARFRLDEKWSAIVGARFSYEEKDFEFLSRRVAYQADPLTAPLLPGAEEVAFQLSRDESRLTPAFTLRYEPNPDLTLFASISEGHKTGGFSDRPQTDVEFDAEDVLAYEIGAKGSFLEGRLNVNLALFYMDLENLQVARAVPGPTVAFEVQNAAEATSQGLELDANLIVNEYLTLGGSLAYTDASYDNFPGAQVGCPVVGGTLDAEGFCNFEGIPLIFAPEWKSTIFAEFTTGPVFGEWELGGRVDANYSDEYYVEINYLENLRQDDYWLLNASLRFTNPDSPLSFQIFGKNLTETYVFAWGLQAGPSQFVTPNAPREIGVQLSYRY